MKKECKVVFPKGFTVDRIIAFSNKAAAYESEIHLHSGSVKVNAKSILGLLSFLLTDKKSVPVYMTASGRDCENAIQELLLYTITVTPEGGSLDYWEQEAAHQINSLWKAGGKKWSDDMRTIMKAYLKC